MKRIKKLVAPLVLGIFGLLSHEASAVLITGEISFNGSYTANSTNLTVATAFTNFMSVVVSAGPTGDYAALAGLPVIHNAFTFDPFPVAGVVPLWSVTGGSGASFDLLNLNIGFESPTAIILTGLGTARLTGKDPTPGSWILSANTLGTTFSFSSTNASNPLPIPEPGTALFGAVLMGVCGTARPRRAARV